jgi:DivIVA domain-containing protein
MPSAELDVPLVPSAEQIRRRMFASVRRGFDPDQVRDYLEQIADQVERLEKEVKESRLAVEAAESKASERSDAAAEGSSQSDQDPYADLSARMAEVLRAADEQAKRLVIEARSEAERLTIEARSEADRVRTDAQAKAEEARYQGAEALRRAREEADRALSGLASRRRTVISQLQEMQQRLFGVAKELESAIDRTDGDDLFGSSPGGSTSISGGASPEGGAESGSAAASTPGPVDPRYEDLWAPGESSGETVDLTDLPSLDIDLGEEGAEEERRKG